MKYNVLTYLIGEGFSNIFKNKKQAATTFLTMCLIMLFFGICFVVVVNFNGFIKQVESQQGVQVFIEKDATEEQIEDVGNQIRALDGVNTTDFVSKKDALEQVKDKFGDKSYLLEGYNENIFKTSYVVTFTDLSKSKDVQEQIAQIENVVKINNEDEVISTLVRIARGIKLGSYAIIIGLIAVSVFIISNTIKLTVYARRKEISIMKYVGATNSFIRWPFMVEGIVIGIISGAISLAMISGVYILVQQSIGFNTFLATIGLSLLEFSSIFNFILIVYLVLGVGIGVIGSSVSMNKYLKV